MTEDLSRAKLDVKISLMPSGVAKARLLLERLAAELEASRNGGYNAAFADRLRLIIEDNLHRRKPVHRAKAQSRPMTPMLRKAITNYAKKNEELTYAEMAKVFNVSVARISECLAGKRG